MSGARAGGPDAAHDAPGDPPAIAEIRAPGGERLFDPKRNRLLGARCARCETVFFPRRTVCPACFRAGAIAEHKLSRSGVIHASTVVRVPSSLGHRPPYAYGYVDLPADGVRVFARFTGDAPERFTPGTAVELTPETIACGDAGAVRAWAFRPATNP